MAPGLRQSRVVHLTVDLEAEIQREVLQLEELLRSDSMDERPFRCNMLAARVHALKWVLDQARVL